MKPDTIRGSDGAAKLSRIFGVLADMEFQREESAPPPEKKVPPTFQIEPKDRMAMPRISQESWDEMKRGLLLETLRQCCPSEEAAVQGTRRIIERVERLSRSRD